MRAILVLILLSIITSCSSREEDLKSPCVGIEGSPCGDRKPVNNWLI